MLYVLLLVLAVVLSPCGSSAFAAWGQDVQPGRSWTSVLGGSTKGSPAVPPQRGALVTPARCSDPAYNAVGQGQCTHAGNTWIPEVREPDIPGKAAVEASYSGIFAFWFMVLASVNVLISISLLWVGFYVARKVVKGFGVSLVARRILR